MGCFVATDRAATRHGTQYALAGPPVIHVPRPSVHSRPFDAVLQRTCVTDRLRIPLYHAGREALWCGSERPNNALKLTGPAQATAPRSLAQCWADLEMRRAS